MMRRSMAKASLRARWQYAFDSLMARGMWALLLWLSLVSFAMITSIAVVTLVAGWGPVDEEGAGAGLLELIWLTLMHSIDAGTITGNEGPVAWQAIMLLATFSGLLIVGSLIGIMAAGVSQRFEELRKGTSQVLEEGHTLVIGWSPQVFTVVREICAANVSRGGGCIVVFADRDKVEMEDELRAKVRNRGRTRVVVRSGDPTDPDALEVVAPEHARSIVVLAETDATTDTGVIRCLLAIGRRGPPSFTGRHIATQLFDGSNVAVANMAGAGRVEAIEVDGLIAKIAVQTCLQAGLSVVYEELLGFEGDEIYIVPCPGVVGRSVGEALAMLSSCALLGLRTSAGEIVLLPDFDRVIRPDDEVIVIAADEDRVAVGASQEPIDESAIVNLAPLPTAPPRTLILGWNGRAPAMLTGLDSYVPTGSEVEVVTPRPDTARAFVAQSRFERISVVVREGQPTRRELLESLDAGKRSHVMVLADDEHPSASEADARALVTLLHLRSLAQEDGEHANFVSEMRDARSRDLAEAARADDFIISDQLIGLLLSQIAEQADLAKIFNNLFDPEGCEIYLRPARRYVQLDVEVSFATILASVRQRGEVALGVRLDRFARDPSKRLGVMFNPSHAERFTLTSRDKIIVLSEG